ncbi:hypothetical protein TWF481_001898 [Arthrobotrys musiformis]|uniref:Uncharacterized protein n=1 Tax=Arthrobotrys musiformis TaxID=47236 RepID=A0AAV9VWF3_9PEZI
MNFEVPKSVSKINEILISNTKSDERLANTSLDIVRQIANFCTTLSSLLLPVQCQSAFQIISVLKLEVSFAFRDFSDNIKREYPQTWALLFDQREHVVNAAEEGEGGVTVGEDDGGQDGATELEIVNAFLYMSFTQWRQACIDSYLISYGRPNCLEEVPLPLKQGFKTNFDKYLLSIAQTRFDLLRSLFPDLSDAVFVENLRSKAGLRAPPRTDQVWVPIAQQFLDSELGIKYRDWPSKTTNALVAYWGENGMKAEIRSQRSKLKSSSSVRPTKARKTSKGKVNANHQAEGHRNKSSTGSSASQRLRKRTFASSEDEENERDEEWGEQDVEGGDGEGELENDNDDDDDADDGGDDK